jgi:hypothetical protein
MYCMRPILALSSRGCDPDETAASLQSPAYGGSCASEILESCRKDLLCTNLAQKVAEFEEAKFVAARYYPFEGQEVSP